MPQQIRLAKWGNLGKAGRVLKPRCQSIMPKSKRAFRTALVDWFKRHGHDYPWRRTHDPYAVLISEVMLQQTQIATVLGKGYYTRFLQAFPNVQALAKASDDVLLKAWEGLGYYRRVRMLRETAKAVVDQYGGVFPQDLAELMALPGIGRYTAGALRAFAFGVPAVLVDGNVARVLARLMDFQQAIDDSVGLRQIWDWAGDFADENNPRAYHAALMEVGQRYCRPGVPDCLGCPVARFCGSSEPERLPIKQRKVKVTAVDEHAIWVMDAKGRLLMHCEAGKRRTGLWKLPLREAGEIGKLPIIAERKYAITRYRVTLRVHDMGKAKRLAMPREGDVWVDREDVAGLAMAAPFRRVVEALLKDS